MRIFTALFGTETNTFSPLPTSIDQFMPNELPASDGKPFEYHLFGMVLRALRERALVEPLDIVQGRGGFAEPNGMTTRTAYETLRDRLLEDLRAAMPVDVVALAMHGAMIADGYEDAEGDLIAEVRRIVGPDVIIGVSGPSGSFRAHAWLDGEPDGEEQPFHELFRIPGSRSV